MSPLIVLTLAVAGGVMGIGVGLVQERQLRKAGGWAATSAMGDVGLERLRWVAPAVMATLAAKTALSDQPFAVLACLPLAVAGPWLLTVHATRIGSPDRVLAATAFLTANCVIFAAAFTGTGQALVTAPLGLVLLTCGALVAGRLLAGTVTIAEVKLAALVGLATGTLGWPALTIAMLCASILGVGSAALGHFRRPALVPALLAAAWVATLAAL